MAEGKGAQAPEQMKIVVSAQGGQVFVDFGKSVRWMQMQPAQAVKMAASIIKIVQGLEAEKAITAHGAGEPEHYKDLVDERAPDPDGNELEKTETLDKEE